jgi:selenocysteine lyase/cysteine desulfurase
MRFWVSEGMGMYTAFQKELAAFINADSPQEIVPVNTTGSALNAVAQSILWERGDNLIFCEVEFPSNAYPWMSLERDEVQTRCVPAVNGGLTLEGVAAVADDRTRMVAVSAIQFFTGHRTDLAAIGAFCREKGILFVVDAIQAIGHIPFDVQVLGIDVLASGGQKSLLAAPGTGFMYVRDSVAETLRPRMIGANATRDYLHWLSYDLTPLPGAQRFANGTPNLVGMFSVVESLSLLRELGVENIDRHTSGLSRYACARLIDRGYGVITPADRLGPIVTFRTGVDDTATDELVKFLAGRNVSVVKHLDTYATPHVRLSFHCYNTTEEIDRFMDVLGEWEKRL